MKQESDFKIYKRPWILYGIGAAVNLAAVIFNLFAKPDLLSVLDTCAFVFMGLVVGFSLITITNRRFETRGKVWTKQDYLGLKGSMIFCWICSILVVFTATEYSWVYAVCLPVSVGCASYFTRYIPKYILLKDEIRKSQERSA